MAHPLMIFLEAVGIGLLVASYWLRPPSACRRSFSRGTSFSEGGLLLFYSKSTVMLYPRLLLIQDTINAILNWQNDFHVSEYKNALSVGQLAATECNPSK